MNSRALLACLALLVACGDDAAPPRAARPAVLDSIRVRRSAALATRPDTLGRRVDSTRALGRADAKLWIVVVSDFQCRACADLALNVLPEVRRDFVDRGLARLAFVNAPQDEHFNARFAAHAALCAASAGRFWEMHDSLFSTQPQWARREDPRPFFDSLAVAAGVPAEAQSSCTARNRLLNLLREDIERSRASGATEVPTLFVGERLMARGQLTTRTVRRAIEEELAKENK